jgi:polyisoprenoid-binding protein YceI
MARVAGARVHENLNNRPSSGTDTSMEHSKSMTTRMAFVLVAAALAMPASALAEGMTWEVDETKSSITFAGRQMGVPVEGSFEKFIAQVDFDPDRPETGRIVVEVDMASVQLPVADVVAEIKKEKWFDVERFPVGRFEASTIEAKGDGEFVAHGKLTLRDVTQDVAFPFSLSLDEAADNLQATAQGELEVSRLAFGVGNGEWGDKSIVADEVGIRIEITGSRPK